MDETEEIQMTVVRRVARPMLAAVFMTGGLDALLHPTERAKVAAPMVTKMSENLSVPNDPDLMVRANGATMLAGGTMLALGRFPRLAALVLALSLIPTTYAGHAFWTVKDPAAKTKQRVQFLKNIGLLGGLLLAAVDTAGKPGLAYRTRHVHAQAHRQAALTAKEAKLATKRARHFAKSALD
jgi:putative oxidoreductase